MNELSRFDVKKEGEDLAVVRLAQHRRESPLAPLWFSLRGGRSCFGMSTGPVFCPLSPPLDSPSLERVKGRGLCPEKSSSVACVLSFLKNQRELIVERTRASW